MRSTPPLTLVSLLAVLALPALAQPAPPPAAPAPAAQPAPDPERCDGRPVLMIVSGPTLDRERMAAYARAIADSRLYDRLGGYYLNAPRALEVFEGQPPANMTTLVVRFPCLANARAFWLSREYQEIIRPMRLNPTGGDYLVTVHLEAEIPARMAGAVEPGRYRKDFDAGTVERARPAPALPQPPTGPFSGFGANPAPPR